MASLSQMLQSRFYNRNIFPRAFLFHVPGVYIVFNVPRRGAMQITSTQTPFDLISW